jgi:hypothetical protein
LRPFSVGFVLVKIRIKQSFAICRCLGLLLAVATMLLLQRGHDWRYPNAFAISGVHVDFVGNSDAALGDFGGGGKVEMTGCAALLMTAAASSALRTLAMEFPFG